MYILYISQQGQSDRVYEKEQGLREGNEKD